MTAPRPPANRVDPRALRWWSLRAALGVLTVAVAELVALAGLDLAGLGRPMSTVLLVATLVAGAGYVAVVPRWRYRVHRWEVDEQAVYTQAGWLWLAWRVAPISRIQTIDTERSPLQRLFRLATVTVTTASSAGAVRIEGLDADVAAALARRLTEVTQHEPGDAT